MKLISNSLIIQSIKNIISNNAYKSSGNTKFKLLKNARNASSYNFVSAKAAYNAAGRRLSLLQKIHTVDPEPSAPYGNHRIGGSIPPSHGTESERLIASAKREIDELFENLPQFDTASPGLKTHHQFLDSTLATIYKNVKDLHEIKISTSHNNENKKDISHLVKLGEVAKQAGLQGHTHSAGYFVPHGAGVNPYISAVEGSLFKKNVLIMNDMKAQIAIREYTFDKLFNKHPDFVNATRQKLDDINSKNELLMNQAALLRSNSIDSGQEVRQSIKPAAQARKAEEKELVDSMTMLIKTTPEAFKHDLERSLL